MGRQGYVWAAFLVVCFLVVGLAGGFALYGAPVPLKRGLAREAVLDQVLLANESPDRDTRLQSLRPNLGDRASAVLDGSQPSLVERVARERATVRDEAEREASAVASRIRLTLVVVTAMAAAFGVGVLGLSNRSA